MGVRSHYDVLGVSKDASQEEIKRAYRRLARQHHPDRNPGDAKAEESFKEVGRAFEIVGDPTKRKLYDELGDDAERIGWDPQKAETYRQWARSGSRGPSGGKGGLGVDLEDLFGGMDPFGMGGQRHGPSGPRRGGDIETRVLISFEDAVRGGPQKLRLTKPVSCATCQGKGTRAGAAPAVCGQCGGSGRMKMAQGHLQLGIPCRACGGSGRVAGPPCPDCQGQGSRPQEVRLEVQIPPGVEAGQKIRLAGQGAPGPGGGPPGDLLIRVEVGAHPYLTRAGADLTIEVPVTVPEALLGAEVEVPTLDGRVKLRVPPGSQSGARLRLKGKGVPAYGSRAAGDLYAVLQVILPSPEEPERTKEAAEAMARLYSGSVRRW
ncbi:MAG: J domain-containing protein [Deltaproteobacteria bacterium]|nr:J domain-containing protein [Deltaproteobacteria bacterium]